ncbi:MAG: MerC family mercury resistance protein [Gemmatimonadota bacterium]
MKSHHATAWGPLGSLFAALCCLGAAPILAALTAVGLGFVINDLILLPLLVLFLGATLWALRRDRPRHGRAGPLVVSAVGALAAVGGLWISGIVVGLGLALLTGGSIWNWALVRAT